jgi:hypothetical protein
VKRERKYLCVCVERERKYLYTYIHIYEVTCVALIACFWYRDKGGGQLERPHQEVYHMPAAGLYIGPIAVEVFVVV